MNGAKKSAFWRIEKRAQLSQVFAVKKHHENRKIDLCHSIPGLATISYNNLGNFRVYTKVWGQEHFSLMVMV
jgi:hypothetical protein